MKLFRLPYPVQGVSSEDVYPVETYNTKVVAFASEHRRRGPATITLDRPALSGLVVIPRQRRWLQRPM